MRLLLINTTCGSGSTGRICLDIAREYEKIGYEVRIAYGREPVADISKQYAVRIGNDFDFKLHAALSRFFDNQGLNSKYTTMKFLEWAENFNPDIVWLHNIHGYYLNYIELFNWIKSRHNMKTIWTLHDCWAFTGHCSYFTMAKCDKWMTGCKGCNHKDLYPRSFLLSCSENNYLLKKKSFTGVDCMQIITPSQWLADLVKKSFLQEYEVIVNHNRIDKSVFCYKDSDFRERYGLVGKKIILGVADGFGKRKGLLDFIMLSKMLPSDYTIVLVGLSDKEFKLIPSNIVGIKRTRNVSELVNIYSAADVFVNATYEDNYPTTNLEAQACGTPCLTYRSGGSPESVPFNNIIDTGDINTLYEKIISITS